MRRRLFFAVIILIWSGQSIFGQSATDPNEGSRLTWDETDKCYRFSWWGRAGRTYFLQYSDDLINWSYLPIIESGEDSANQGQITVGGDSVYFRLRHTDRSSTDPAQDDFDSDGLSNLEEVQGGGDPLVRAPPRAVWLVWGAQGFDVYPDYFTLDVTGLNPLTYLKVSPGWISLSGDFNVDPTGPPSPIWFGIKSFPTEIPYHYQGEEIYTTDPASLPEGHEVYMGIGWISDSLGFVPDFERSSSSIWYGLKSFGLAFEYVFTHEADDLTPDSQLSVGKGWITAKDSFRADFRVPATPVWVGTKTIQFYVVSGVYTHDPEELNPGTAQLQGNGWIQGPNFIADDGTLQADADGDGLINAEELHWFGTDPNEADDDGDGLNDGEEIQRHTNPLHFDSDDDLLSDGWEIAQGLDPLSGDQDGNGVLDTEDDFDGDGLSNLDESSFSSDPLNADTDGDGVVDGIEVSQGSFPDSPDDGGSAPEPWNPAAGTGASPPGDLPEPGDAIRLRLKIGDNSSSHSERYTLVVTDTTTGKSFQHQAPEFGKVSEEVYAQFRYGHAYKFQVRHTGTDPEHLESAGQADFDGEAGIELVDSPYTLQDLGYIVIDPYDPASQQVVSDQPKVFGNWSDQEDFATTIANYEAHLLRVNIVPDFNRDGVINDQDRDKVTTDKPWRWWINDDDDHGATNGDDIPGRSDFGDRASGSLGRAADYGTESSFGYIDGIRDLVDYFPLYLDIKKLLEIMPPGQNAKYKLRQQDGALNFSYTDLTADSVRDFLTKRDGNKFDNATTLGSWEVHRITNTGFDLHPVWLNEIKSVDGYGVILLEGRANSTKPLVLEVSDSQGKKLAELKFQISIDGVEQMFRHKNLLAAGGGSGGPSDRLGDPPNYPDSLTSDQAFVLVHGYNVDPESARGWGAEVFKRLFWSGSRAKFYNVSWFGYETRINILDVAAVTINYQANVNNAFATANSLASFLNGLNNVSVAAHSLGNMLVGSAVHDWGARPSRYFMIDAAVARECYDDVEEQLTSGGEMGMEHPSWAPHERRLWCSDWHQLPFAAGDHRSNLTWKSRLENVSAVAAYNFYSTGEEVLKNPNSNPHLPLSATEVWNNQERMKGRMLTGQVLSSNYGGWEVSDYWDVEDTFDDPSGTGPPETVMRHRYPSETGTITDEQLKFNPFFNQGPAELYGANGSNYASPQQHRNTLLAEMVPALSFAAGANALEGYGEGANFDMMLMKNGWPQERLNQNNPNWFHSDIKVVAYLYTHEVFLKMIELGDLKN